MEYVWWMRWEEEAAKDDVGAAKSLNHGCLGTQGALCS